MRLVLTGGGTGGHVYPALAIANYIKSEEPSMEILYIGSKRGLEGDILSKTELPFAAIQVSGLPRQLNRALFESLGQAVTGVRQARKLLKDFQPDVVLGTGGFVAGPVVLAAAQMGFPSLIHEQNAYPGLTNRILAPMVDGVMLNFPQAASYFKGPVAAHVVGLPVRQEIGHIDKAEARRKYRLDPQRPVLLVTGGSRGARTINRVVAMACGQLLSKFDVQILFITGKDGYAETSLLLRECGITPSEEDDLVLLDYAYDMPTALAAADVMVGRAGATFLAEVAAAGLPGILVPYPYASDNHQFFNAQAMEDAGAAIAIEDKNFTVPVLMEALAPFIKDPAYLQRKQEAMAAYAVPDVLERIMALVQEAARKPTRSRIHPLRRFRR